MKKKIVFLGDSAVGKTSLIRRYVFDQFDDAYIATIGSKVTKKELTIQQKSRSVHLNLIIWDLIGREGYHALHARTLFGVQGAILVSDLTRLETLKNLEQYWIPFLLKVVGMIPIVFACNKSDLRDEFEFNSEDMKEFAIKYNNEYDEILPDGLESCYFTSAKNGSNVESAFESLGNMVLYDKDLRDPIKELYYGLVTTGIQRRSDSTTAIGALDAIIVDFCKGFEDSKTAMVILRQEITRAGIDISNPDKNGILKAVEYLAEAENEFKDYSIVKANMEKRLKWANKIKE